MAKHLLSGKTRSYLLRSELVSSPPSICQVFKGYSQSHEEEDHAIGEKARSTAEEFSRVAKEKAETATETVKETGESAKEAVVGESESESESDTETAKGEYKDTIERGKYDKMGQQ